MIVTLRTLQPRTQKDPHGIGHVVQGHAPVPQIVTDSPRFPHRTIRGNQVPHKFVIGPVLTDEFLDELGVVGRDKACIIRRPVDPQDVGPEMKIVIYVTFAIQQHIH